MFKYVQKLFSNFLIFFILIGLALANWQWPFYMWLDAAAIYRFIWLAIFFVLLDILIEIILHSIKEVQLMTESLSFSKDIRKLSEGFYAIPKVFLLNNLKADYIVVGSSGIWLIDIEDNDGKVEFNGDELVQGGVVLKGLATKALEK